MLVEMNIALLGAIAIVASLLSAIFDTKLYNRWAAYAILGFGLSGVLSTIVLFDIVRPSVFGGSQTSSFYQAILTYTSLFAFLIATEILIFISFKKFWKKGRTTRRV